MRNALLAGAVVVCCALGPGAASAADTPPGGEDAASTGILQRTLYRTLSYQTVSSLDDFAFGCFLGGGAAVGGLLVLANAVTETAVNYAHDLSWAVAAQDMALSEADTRRARTATYTAVNTMRVLGLGLLFTGSAAASLGYVAFALQDYLTIREVPAEGTVSIRVVPSRDGTLIRIVRLPGS